MRMTGIGRTSRILGRGRNVRTRGAERSLPVEVMQSLKLQKYDKFLKLGAPAVIFLII